MQQISGPIFEDKVIDFILEMAKVSEVVIDRDTLYQADESVAAQAKKAEKKSAKKAGSKKPSSKNPQKNPRKKLQLKSQRPKK